MLVQRPDILCNYVLHKPVERVLHVLDHLDKYYSEFTRVKKDRFGKKKQNKPQYTHLGKYWCRIINPPKGDLKEIQKRINTYLVDKIQMPEYAFGGIKGKDNILNARFHKGQKYVFQTDLKDFFPNITNKMVYEMYVREGFSHDVSAMLTKLTTYKGHLPQGAPTSTTIANLVFKPTGMALQTIADREGLSFTTFVDDVTMSSQNDFKHVVSEIIGTITSCGYRISQGKTTYRSGITDITGVRMLNNSMIVTDKIETAIAKEEDLTSPRAKGLLNYKERIKALSKAKKKRGG